MKLIVSSTADGQHDQFFFNISANVGLYSPNKQTDVQLVQFGYFALSKGLGNSPKSPQLLAAAGAVVVGAPYSGGPSDPLTLAIQADQREHGGTQDGHVSVMRGASLSYDNVHSYQLLRLMNHLRLFVGNAFWPRIDLHAMCPGELAQSVRRSFAL